MVVCCGPRTYPQDGAGLDGNGDISVSFATLQAWIGVDFPGYLTIDLYRQGELFASVEYGFSGIGNFGGLISTEPFDAAVLIDPGGEAEIDDLHFGTLACASDLDGNGAVGLGDLQGLLTAWGTDPGGPPDLDGNGDVGVVDFLALLGAWGICPNLPDCNGNGLFDFSDIQDGTSQDCNANAVPDECDIAGGTSPDYDADGIPDECQPPSNDDCQDALAVGEGAAPFNTLGATVTDSLIACPLGILLVNDIWYLYTPSCTGYATFSVCNDASFDTVLAVYFAFGCPVPTTPLACSDDAPGCGQTSQMQALVVEGFPYLVRVAGKEEGGIGVLTVSCRPLP
jgi:hypothetical protein